MYSIHKTLANAILFIKPFPRNFLNRTLPNAFLWLSLF